MLLLQGNVLWDESEMFCGMRATVGQPGSVPSLVFGEEERGGGTGRRSLETVQASPMKGFRKLMEMATPSSFVPCCLCPGNSVKCNFVPCLISPGSDKNWSKESCLAELGVLGFCAQVQML